MSKRLGLSTACLWQINVAWTMCPYTTRTHTHACMSIWCAYLLRLTFTGSLSICFNSYITKVPLSSTSIPLNVPTSLPESKRRDKEIAWGVEGGGEGGGKTHVCRTWDHCSNLSLYWRDWFIFASPGDALITWGKSRLYFGWLWGDSSRCVSEMGANRKPRLCRPRKRKWAWCENDSGAVCSSTDVVVGKMSAIRTEQPSLLLLQLRPPTSRKHPG